MEIKYKYGNGPIEFIDNNKDIYGMYSFRDIPKNLIVHGSVTVFSSRDIKIVGVYNKYYLVRYQASSNGSQFATLGFLEKDLKAVEGTIYGREITIDRYSII